MKFRKYLMIVSFTFGLAAFTTSCQDNNRQAENEIELEAERDAQRAEQERLQRERMDRENNSVAARIEDRQELSTFSQGMNRAQISDDFTQNEGPYTVFAPSNEAYEGLPQQDRDQMMNEQDPQRNMATAHYLIVEEELTRDQLRSQIENNNGTYTLRTMHGEELTATMENDEIVIRDASGNTARITDVDEEASNGVIFIIDTVLRPQDNTQSQAASRMDSDNVTNDNMQNTNMQNNNMQNNNMQNNTDNNTGNTTGTNNTGNTTGNNNTGTTTGTNNR